MKRLGATLALSALLVQGCGTFRTTTTARTAREQALLSQAAEATLAALRVDAPAGKLYFIKEDAFEAPDEKYVLGLVHRKLLETGMRAASHEEEAEILVYPSVAHAAIDERRGLIGISELPIAIPGVGAITLPELTLLKREIQWGRNRMQLFGRHARSGQLAFASDAVSSERYYSRWTLLFLISFRLTNLLPPH
jgi:hypothetical protein